MNISTTTRRRLSFAAALLAVGVLPVVDAAPVTPGERALATSEYEPHLQGVARPGRNVSLSATQEGVLMSILVEEGQRVRKGQPLAILDNRVATAGVKAARAGAENTADLQRARTSLELATSRFERTRKSNQSGGSTDFEIEEARAAMLLAEADVKAAEEAHERAVNQLALEEARLAEHTIVAPFDATVARISAEEGQTITRDDDVLTLVNIRTLKAEVYLPVSNYRRVFANTDYTLIASEPVGRSITGRLVFIEPVIDPATRTFRCVFTIDNADESLPAGFLVRVDAQSIQTALARQGDDASG